MWEASIGWLSILWLAMFIDKNVYGLALIVRVCVVRHRVPRSGIRARIISGGIAWEVWWRWRLIYTSVLLTSCHLSLFYRLEQRWNITQRFRHNYWCQILRRDRIRADAICDHACVSRRKSPHHIRLQYILVFANCRNCTLTSLSESLVFVDRVRIVDSDCLLVT